MGEQTGIAWTHHTFNPWWGCTKVSTGCAHCYAESTTIRFGMKVWGEGVGRKTFSQKHWNEPLKWARKAREAGERRRVFSASMADVFDDQGPASERERLWALIRETPDLDWLLLTKRPENVAAVLPGDWGAGYANVWLGVTAEDQANADRRIPILLELPARVRFLSCEPLVEPLDLTPYLLPGFTVTDDRDDAPDGALVDGMERVGDQRHRTARIDWVIVGGESGAGARPMSPAWARSVRDQCRTYGTKFFFKQWGEYRESSQVDLDTRMRYDGRYYDATCSPELVRRFHDDGTLSPAGSGAGRAFVMYRVGRNGFDPDLLDGERLQEVPFLPGDAAASKSH